MHIGIDYGSKLAGTTSICYQSEGRLHFLTSKKKEDADEMIQSFLASNHEIDAVFIDAPLSLPNVYSEINSDAEDYFYRSCDREISAMSPMFLGGLTARAMKLAHFSSKKNVKFFESYPSGLVDELGIDRNFYKKETKHISPVIDPILETFQLELKRSPEIWHEVDALLAYIIGMRYSSGKVKTVGDPDEGLIYF